MIRMGLKKSLFPIEELSIFGLFEIIPKIFTDTGTKGASDVNAGLMIISPNQKEYDSLIKEITSPVSKWMGPGKKHIGFYDMYLNKNSSIT